MKQIHHYTTIEALALILKYKTLRFTRLDLLDDQLEGANFSIYNPLKYIFASSWTKDKNENISLWKMYSSIEMGVRLSIPINYEIFNKYEITFRDFLQFGYSQNNEMNTQIDKAINSPSNKDGIDQVFFYSQVSPKKFCNEDYFIQCGDKQIYFKDVIYENNFLQIYENLITKEADKYYINNNTLFGQYKTEYWSFQNESRFIIITCPSCGNEKNLIERNYHNKNLKTNNIDIDLNNSFFENLTITLAPKITEGNKLIVEALTKDIKGIKIKESELKDVLR